MDLYSHPYCYYFPTYQVLIVVVGALFGQFEFFWNFEKKMLAHMGFKQFKDKKQWLAGVPKLKTLEQIFKDNDFKLKNFLYCFLSKT